MQLGKLQTRLGKLKAEGAEVLAISIDKSQEARRMAVELGLTFPLLSDPSMQVIRAYGMKGEGMEMADMGYVVIDTNGRIRVRRIDRKFGENTQDLIRVLKRLKAEA